MNNQDYGCKHIRDNVHGDIAIPQRFLDIINTPEFQRLRRIRQLATAQYVFPSADHTRFAHSIGTFAVMQRIIAHFEEYFRLLGRSDLITERKKDVLLAAALLHDLGHTPFSHALEDVLPNAQKVPHERWTVDIIKNEDRTKKNEEEKDANDGMNGTGEEKKSEDVGKNKDKEGEEEKSLRRVLDSWFKNEDSESEKRFYNEVAEFILLQHEENAGPGFDTKDININKIFRSLISSQIDADRLDYIRRDSLATGVSYGLIDIDHLIRGFRIGILEDGTATTCIAQEYLPDIEGYLNARYQMYRNVYLHPFKILTEELLRKIIRTVYKLYEDDKLNASDLPAGFRAALQQPRMTIEDFLSLDDYVIMGAIKGWAKLTDKRLAVLQKLCQCLINRTGFVNYTFSDVSDEALERFKRTVFELLEPYYSEAAKKELLEERIKDFPFLVLETRRPTLYKKGPNSIYIMENTGRLVEISDCSSLIRAFVRDNAHKGEGEERDTDVSEPSLISAIYFSKDVLRTYLKQKDIFGELNDEDIREIMKNIEGLFEQNSSNNMIEIEKKYAIYDGQPGRTMDSTEINLFLKCLSDQGYSCEAEKTIIQVDQYFDTEDNKLNNNHCTLRIRVKDEAAEITCKRPVIGSRSCGREGQMERYEYNRKLGKMGDCSTETLFSCTESVEFVKTHLSDVSRFDELQVSLIIENTRTQYTVTRKTEVGQETKNVLERYEVAFDTVKYNNLRTGKTYSEQQIELELKADPIYRLNMQILTEKIESDPNLAGLRLKQMTDSKYERALRFTEQ